MQVTIPNTHLDLFQKQVHGVLTTMMPDGMPQSSIVWVDYDGECVLINTTLERQKGRNMQLNPRVTILVIDPNDSGRWVEVRGQVREMTQDCAEAHAISSRNGIVRVNNIFIARFICLSRGKMKHA